MLDVWMQLLDLLDGLDRVHRRFQEQSRISGCFARFTGSQAASTSVTDHLKEAKQWLDEYRLGRLVAARCRTVTVTSANFQITV
jgi:hypothetical protein